MSKNLQQLLRVHAHAYDFVSNLSIVGILSAAGGAFGLFWSTSHSSSFMAADSVKINPCCSSSYRYDMDDLCLAGAVGSGFIGIAYFHQHPEFAAVVTANLETVFMELTKILFNPWVVGVILAAILSAVMRYNKLSVIGMFKKH